MINYRNVFRTLLSLKDKLITIFVLADQSPARTEMNYYANFPGQKIAFYDGMKKVTRALNYAVVYLDIKRIQRWHYKLEIIPITRITKETEEGFITNEYIRLLEVSINQQPDNWLWSHRRWKSREEHTD